MADGDARWLTGLAGGVLALAATSAAEAQTFASADIERLSIEQLSSLEITSVSRRPEPVSGAAAAIYAITPEDIVRAGARTLPEALRLAPNLHVARIDSGTYAISARGFNQSTGTANKLLVLIDGRAVYTPLYAGVFWDAQNVMLEDVERIEAISGPGGTLWGANAVNGVINVITRPASETLGARATAEAGTHNTTLALRYGGALGPDGAFRIYGLGLQRGPSESATGQNVGDELDNLQGGFRADWALGRDDFTVQGDAYDASNEFIPGEVRETTSSGGNVLARWTHGFRNDAGVSVQAYYDRQRRTISSGILSVIDAWDIEGQLDFAPAQRHRVVLGGGVRHTEDAFARGPGTAFLDPDRRTLRLAQTFVQDTWSPTDALDITLGVKAEHNSYTGWEYLPSVRGAWRIGDEATLWAAVSRAVRTPARFDRDLINPGLLAGGPSFESEVLNAFELGLRMQPSARLNVSVSTYYNDYDELRSVEAAPVTVFPLTVANRMEGQTYGLEAWADFAPADWWRLSAGANFLRKDLELEPGSRDFFGVGFAGNDPGYKLTLRSLMNFPGGVSFDISGRAIDDLPSPKVPAYIAVDARVAWRVTERVELALSGYNLTDDAHPEFANASIPVRHVPRSALVTLSWKP